MNNSIFNYYGTWVLFIKEIKRFLAVSLQTIFAPVINAILYLIIFYPFGEYMTSFSSSDHEYGVFLIPGLVMMTVLQNAFSNSSSSMIQSKFYGNVTFMLLAPLSAIEIYTAFVAAAILRGLLVGFAVFLCGWILYDFNLEHPLLVILFTILCSGVMGAMGLIVGIWADKFDHLAGFQNFVILPMTFLSGVFYSINKLPPLWQHLSLYNPFLYMIDGLRYTTLGFSDQPFWKAVIIVTLMFIALSWWCCSILNKGYKLRY